MKTENKKVVGIGKLKTPPEKIHIEKTPEQQFNEEYQKLCAKYKLNLAASPIFIQTNHDSFEIGIQYGLKRIE